MSSPENEECLLRLALIPGFGSKTIHNLISRFPQPRDILGIDQGTLVEKFKLTQEAARLIHVSKHSGAAENELALMKKLNVAYVTSLSENYPRLLKEIPNPPPVLFYKGDLKILNNFCVAFVGSRKPSFYGKKNTKRLVNDFAALSRQITIVSGLALGIDSEAHATSLERNLPTVAVLGGGLNKIYPTENIRLSEQIVAAGGLVLSEYSCNARPIAQQFPMRNRIISGLSQATLVMEAGENSGALITAKFALEHNRDVFALPGPVDMLNYVGCNRLIQKGGAKLLINISDVLEEFTLQTATQHIDFIQQENQLTLDFEKQKPNLNEVQTSILDLLAGTPMSADEISRRLKIPISKLLGVISELEIKGLITSESGGLYVKI